MPVVEIDVEAMPDIIEAQLTLSYGRLSDLIRLIIGQGNGHESDIAVMRGDIDRLHRESAGLRQELDVLHRERAAAADGASAQLLTEELQGQVVALTAAQSAAEAKQAADNASRDAAEAALRDGVSSAGAAAADAQERLGALAGRVREVEQTAGLPKAFTDLWGAKPELVYAMALPEEEEGEDRDNNGDGDGFAHSAAERAAFLNTLPAFAALHEELAVLRGVVGRQSVEAITAAAKTSSRRGSALPSSGGGGGGTQLPEVHRLAAAVRSLEQRLDGSEQDTQSRLHRIEEALGVMLSIGGGGDGASSSPDGGAMLANVDGRLRGIEQTVEGSRRGSSNSNSSNRHAPKDSGGETDGGAAAAAAEATTLTTTIAADGEVVHSNFISGLSHSQLSESASKRPGSGRPPTTLPPLLTTATTTAALTPHSPGGGSGASLPQPTVEALRHEVRRNPGLTAAAAQGRRISLAVEPEDGLRLRVAQLEENVAILEVHKADRRELLALEEALRGLQQQQQLPGGVTFHQQQQQYAPHRPSSAPYDAVNRNNSTGEGFGRPGSAAQSSAGNRPCSATPSLGRPVFVGGGSGSVYLRDVANNATYATVSPSSH